MSAILAWLDGKKTYLSALGLAGLGIYQLVMAVTTKDWSQAALAWQSFMAALAALGLRAAVSKAATQTQLAAGASPSTVVKV